MGRHSSHEYQVKNTFVEIQIPVEDVAEGFGRSQRAFSDGAEQASLDCGLKGRLDDYLAVGTPSPFMHPSQDPCLLMQMEQLPLAGYGLEDPAAGGNIAFGDFSVDCTTNGFEGIDVNYNNGMYDPSTGMYMTYDWSMPYNNDGYCMMGGMPVEGGVDEFGNCMSIMPNAGVGHTEQLLAALSEKISAGRETDDTFGQPGFSPDCAEGGIILTEGYGEAMGQSLDMDGNHLENWNATEDWNAVEMQGAQLRSDGGGRKKRERERGGRGGGAQEFGAPQNTSSSAPADLKVSGNCPTNFTTVMFRNIPNKYTREMLVKQLEQDMKGHFDFVYLPIDFKNQCNVGYAFINFRSFEACDLFMQNFNGVEVRKCLPGLNSRKVTEVTPARVQGFEDNVQRLRNSPVMRELAHHPEWMPLIFDENGVNIHFPSPERTLEPIKPRRRVRDDA